MSLGQGTNDFCQGHARTTEPFQTLSVGEVRETFQRV